MTNDWRPPASAEAALRDAQQAIDNAIRTMFELATRLELLREAIDRANRERMAGGWMSGQSPS